MILNLFTVRSYESIIATLCESLDTLDEPEAKVGHLSFQLLSDLLRYLFPELMFVHP